MIFWFPLINKVSLLNKLDWRIFHQQSFPCIAVKPIFTFEKAKMSIHCLNKCEIVSTRNSFDCVVLHEKRRMENWISQSYGFHSKTFSISKSKKLSIFQKNHRMQISTTNRNYFLVFDWNNWIFKLIFKGSCPKLTFKKETKLKKIGKKMKWFEFTHIRCSRKTFWNNWKLSSREKWKKKENEKP